MPWHLADDPLPTMTDTPSSEATTAPAQRPPRRRPSRPQGKPGARPAQPATAMVNPVLEALAASYPGLFGAEFLPLKRGIFEDLMQAHPEQFTPEALKSALAFHTRSTKYLTVMAQGHQRHDLQLQPVEALAPEHVYHALQEVFRRRARRADADPIQLRHKRVARIQQAFEASGLAREDYAARMRGRDEEANAALDEALAAAAERSARDEALLRAFEASGAADVAAFADMYGMDPRAAGAALERARRGPDARTA